MCCSTSKAVIIPNLEMSISLLLERCLVTDSYGFYLRERVLLSDKAFGKYNLLMRLFFLRLERYFLVSLTISRATIAASFVPLMIFFCISLLNIHFRRSAAGIFDERWAKEPEATPPSVRRKQVDDTSPEVDDVRHGYHQQRTPSPPPPPQSSQSALSRGQNRSRAEGGGRYASNSRRSSKSGRSPSPSSHRV